MRFEDLTGDDRALIRSVVNALNRATDDFEATELALIHPEHSVWTAPERHQQREDSWARKFDDLTNEAATWGPSWRETWADYRKQFELLAKKGRLPSASVTKAVEVVNRYVAWETKATLSPKGRVEFSTRPKFPDADTAVAFVLLQLSALERPLLLCAECKTFVVVTKTAGRRSERFCSTRCRVLFNQRAFYDREKRKSK